MVRVIIDIIGAVMILVIDGDIRPVFGLGSDNGPDRIHQVRPAGIGFRAVNSGDLVYFAIMQVFEALSFKTGAEAAVREPA